VWVLSIVWIAILERLKMVLVQKLVKLAVQDNIKLPQEMLRVNNALLGSVKTTKDKRRALNAAPVNLAIPPVVPHANRALPTPITVTKEETPRALVAQRVGPRWPAVPRAPRAVPAPTATGAKIAPGATPDTAPTPTPRNASNAPWVTPRPIPAQRSAPVAIWVGTAAAKATVPAARPTNTKTPVANSNVNHARPQAKCPMNNTQLVPNPRGPPPPTAATTNTSTTRRPTTRIGPAWHARLAPRASVTLLGRVSGPNLVMLDAQTIVLDLKHVRFQARVWEQKIQLLPTCIMPIKLIWRCATMMKNAMLDM